MTARMPADTKWKRLLERSADRYRRKAARTRKSASQSSGEASRLIVSVSHRTLNCGRPCTVTAVPPPVVSGRMEYRRDRRSRGFTREAPPIGRSSITSTPAITRTAVSPYDFSRYQCVPMHTKPTESSACSSGDSAPTRGSARKGT